jgi:hypothetical protein
MPLLSQHRHRQRFTKTLTYVSIVFNVAGAFSILIPVSTIKDLFIYGFVGTATLIMTWLDVFYIYIFKSYLNNIKNRHAEVLKPELSIICFYGIIGASFSVVSFIIYLFLIIFTSSFVLHALCWSMNAVVIAVLRMNFCLENIRLVKSEKMIQPKTAENTLPDPIPFVTHTLVNPAASLTATTGPRTKL